MAGQPSTAYSSNARYEAHGGLKSVALGNNLVESWSYIPSRQQPWKIQLGTPAQPSSVDEFVYDYCPSTPFLGGSCASNNGNVMGQKRGSLGAAKTVYAYDTMNRLVSATESGNGTGYSRTYGYDGFGNGWVTANSGVVLSSFTPTAKTNFGTDNRLYINNAAYNDSGNQTAIGGYTFKWDGENRMVESVIGGVTTAYVYDGEGRRVKKVKTTTAPATTTETRYVYNASGTLAAEYGPAEAESDTEYFMADHLGSTRLVTHANGTPKRALDYLPFGEEIPQGVSGRGALYPADGATPTSGKKFTGQLRDAETGLDYYLTRYLNGGQGRFTNPDIPFAGQYSDDPQSWNLYTYALNNPLLYSDPTGRAPCEGGYNPKTGDFCIDATVRQQGLNPLEQMIYQHLLRTVTIYVETAKVGKQAAQGTLEWLSQPRDPGCLAAFTGGGAVVGAAAGLAGLAGGGTVFITVPSGFLAGGIAGYAGGMTSCMSGTGGGSTAGGGETAQHKKLSSSEIKKIETATGESAHQIKQEALGTNKSISQYDLYKDTSGNVFVKGKSGIGEAIPTGLKIN